MGLDARSELLPSQAAATSCKADVPLRQLDDMLHAAQLCLLQGVSTTPAAVYELGGDLPCYCLRYQFVIAGILELPDAEGSGLTKTCSMAFGNLLEPKQPDVVNPPPAHIVVSPSCESLGV